MIIKFLNKIHAELYPHRFVILLSALLCIFVINIFYPVNIYGGQPQLIYLPFLIAACCLVFETKKRILYLISFVVAFLLLSKIFDMFFTQNLSNGLSFFYICFYSGVLCEVIRQIYNADLTAIRIIMAGVCGLLLIGYFGFYIFLAIELYQPGSFNHISQGIGSVNDLFYFSFITILTVGYGFITPNTWIAKNATILVALAAYIYSWVVIATIVGEATSLKAERKAARESKQDAAISSAAETSTLPQKQR